MQAHLLAFLLPALLYGQAVPDAMAAGTADPRHEAMAKAVDRIHAGHFREGAAILEDLLNKEGDRPADALSATAWNNLGLAYQELGRWTEAERAFRRSLSINERLSGRDNPWRATRLSIWHPFLRQWGAPGRRNGC